jgi:hypothetical protein
MAYNYNPFGAGAGNDEPEQSSGGGDFFWNPLGGQGVYDNPAPAQSAFNPFQAPAPSYEPEQSARMSAFDQMGSDPSGGWNYTPAANGAPDRYQTDQPLVFDLSKPEPYTGAPVTPAATSGPPASGYSSPMDGGRMSPEQQYASQVRTNAETGARAQETERIGADLAQSRADISRQAMQEQNELRAAYDENLKRAQAISRQRMQDFAEMKPEGLFAKSDGGNREALLATMVLSGVADAMSGNMQRGGYVPSAMPALESAMAKNKADNIQRLNAAQSQVKLADRDVEQVKSQYALDRVDIEHRAAAQWDYLSKDAAAQVASMAPGEARTKAEQGRVLIEQKADEAQLKAREAAEKLAMQQVDLEMKQRKLHAVGHGAGGPKMKEASAGELAGLEKAETDIRAMSSLEKTIADNPKAWEEFRANRESWRRTEEASKSGVTGTLRRMAQGANLANISEDQGLTTPEAKEIYKGMNRLGTSIAKGYGGAITSYDTQNAANEMGQLSASQGDMLDWLSNQKKQLTSGRDLVLSNRRVEMPASSAGVPITPGNTVPAGIRAAPAAPIRKQGNDGKWYVKGPGGWMPE